MDKHKTKLIYNKDNEFINTKTSGLSCDIILENKEQEQNNENWKNDCILLKDITLNEKTLYIIGNGFDLMHGVKSSYYNFRDFLKKRNPELKAQLESYIRVRDIWAEFENSLGKIDINMITGSGKIKDSLEISGFLGDIESYSKYYLALDLATSSMKDMTENLEKYFRNWVKNLQIGTNDHPLSSIIRNDKVLSFNYTEFIEELYKVSETNICYIHGCRKNKKEKLILGHKSDIDYGKIEKSPHNMLIDLLQEDAMDIFSRYDEDITKNTSSIIESHQDFFKSLTDIKNIVVIGHSLSEVDWDYFKEVAKNVKNANWYFSCYNYYDFQNVNILSNEIKINPIMFRIDNINITLVSEKLDIIKKQVYNEPKPKIIQSFDGKWEAQWFQKKLSIIGENCKIDHIMRQNIKKCIFSPDGRFLFIIFNIGIALFKFINGTWVYIKFNHRQNILNRRLRHIYINRNSILFIYNNRITEFSLENGDIIKNVAKLHAKDFHYQGVEISNLFI